MLTKKTSGFTLIEVLLALMISAIIAAIAYPSYLTYMMESRRQDAISAIMQDQQIVENYRMTNNSGNIPTLAQVQSTNFALLSNKAYYALTYCVDNASSPSLYYIVATATPSKANSLGTCIDISGQTLTSNIQSNDTNCLTMTAHSQFAGIFPANCR
jgi:type IV pilus assembly protein PilE